MKNKKIKMMTKRYVRVHSLFVLNCSAYATFKIRQIDVIMGRIRFRFDYVDTLFSSYKPDKYISQ